MHIKVSKFQLDKVIDRVSRIYEPNPYQPQYKGLYVEATDSKIIFTLSNERLSIQHTLISSGKDLENFDSESCQILVGGFALIPLPLFRNIIKSMNGPIELIKKGTLLIIKNDQDKFEMNLMDESFGTLDFRLLGDKINLNINNLKTIYNNVAFAADVHNETNELAFRLINIKAQNGKMTAIATNSYRLATETLDIESDAEFSFLISPKNLKELLSFDIKGDVDFVVNDSRISIVWDDSVIYSLIYKMDYKDTSKVIPKSFDSVLVIEKRVLANLLNKTKVFHADRSNRIRLTIKDGILTLATKETEVGRAEATTNEFTYNEEKLDMFIVNRYLTDAINVFDGELNILFADNNRRIVVISPNYKNNVQVLTPQKGHVD
ncbi:DNA polymerase III subunit beta family protein [[Mycoplasma] gypis]|uniref:DNA polymerase III subunit beta n=1 Tax=[Mycoplasma] gypis TaxID=92404 RepID=A0ABZ2RQQ7_9BACT|nr:DNA polymerase III subunit beta [[Mycoplasma] gypis]MBN0919567.1 hypothetical protein [[Mycoplasma] gypis]